MYPQFQISWSSFDTVLLDMDGTLLDLHFDDYFWFNYLPEQYKNTHGGDITAINSELGAKIMAQKGKQTWYDLGFWSEQLQLDVIGLKQKIASRIKLLPHSIDFLNCARDRGKQLYLTTNADPASMDLKLGLTKIGAYFERTISAFEYGFPKEDGGYWQALRQDINFKPKRTLFVDDNQQVLNAAVAAQIGHVVGLTKPCSMGKYNQLTKVNKLAHLGELLSLLDAQQQT